MKKQTAKSCRESVAPSVKKGSRLVSTKLRTRSNATRPSQFAGPMGLNVQTAAAGHSSNPRAPPLPLKIPPGFKSPTGPRPPQKPSDGRRLHRRRSSGSARTRGQGQDAVRGGGRHNGRRKTRSDHPAACQSVQPCRDPQARRYGARPRRPSLDRRSCVFRGRRRRRMRARRDQDRRRPASRQNARLQMGQPRNGS